MRVTKKPSGRVIFFFCCKSCNFFFLAVNACNKKTVRWCNFFFFAVSRVSRLTRLTAKKKKLHDYTFFLLRAFTAKKKNYTSYNIHFGSAPLIWRPLGPRRSRGFCLLQRFCGRSVYHSRSPWGCKDTDLGHASASYSGGGERPMVGPPPPLSLGALFPGLPPGPPGWPGVARDLKFKKPVKTAFLESSRRGVRERHLLSRIP